MKQILAFLLFIFFISPSFADTNLKEQAKTYRQEGYRLQSRGDLEGALVYYQKAAELDPNYAEVYNDLGVVYESLGAEEAAVKMYKKAVEIDPYYLPPYTNLALFYENKKDIDNVAYYWLKRYEFGESGEYWEEVAARRLAQLGEVYPELKEKIEQRAAERLSRELAYRYEQERLKTINEAKFHFDMGSNLFSRGDYAEALKEFETASFLNPADEGLKKKITNFYRQADKKYTKEELLIDVEQALNYIKQEDFDAAGKKLKEALSVVFHIITQSKK